jgi:hypothetical protein
MPVQKMYAWYSRQVWIGCPLSPEYLDSLRRISPMTITYSSTSGKDKDFQNEIDEHFRGISEQIRSLQKVIANQRCNFDYRLSQLENLLLRHRRNNDWYVLVDFMSAGRTEKMQINRKTFGGPV